MLLLIFSDSPFFPSGSASLYSMTGLSSVSFADTGIAVPAFMALPTMSFFTSPDVPVGGE